MTNPIQIVCKCGHAVDGTVKDALKALAEHHKNAPWCIEHTQKHTTQGSLRRGGEIAMLCRCGHATAFSSDLNAALLALGEHYEKMAAE